MKKVVIFVFLFLSLCLSAKGLTVLFLAPLGSNFSTYAEQMYNGMKLSLPDSVNLIQLNSTKPFENYLNLYKPEIIVGPFLDANVKRLLNRVCNKQIYVLLPFSKNTDNCSNVFFFGYDPLQAVKEVANEVCNSYSQNIAVFYSFNRLNMTEKNEFLKDIAICGKGVSIVSGIPTFFNLMDQFVRDTFGVRKLKNFSGLTEGRIFTYDLRLDALLVFAPSDVLAHLLDVLDYYDIYPDTIYSTDDVVDRNIMSLRRTILKHLNIVTPYYMCNSSEISVNFLKNYRQQYYEDPTQFSALGFDLGSVISWILKTGSIAGFNDKNLLEGHLLFFDDKNRAVINYKKIGYKEILRCRRQILSK